MLQEAFVKVLTFNYICDMRKNADYTTLNS